MVSKRTKKKRAHQMRKSIIIIIISILLLTILMSVSIYRFETPNAPQNLKATPGNNNVSLIWKIPKENGSTKIKYYNIYRNGTRIISKVINTTYIDYTVVDQISYEYRVSATNQAGEGPKSNIAKAIPCPTIPGPPWNLKVIAGNWIIKLIWTAPLSDGGSPISNYKIYRGVSSNAETFLISIGDYNIFRDRTVINGQTYYYKISAVNSVGEGIRSIEKNGTSFNTLNNSIWYQIRGGQPISFATDIALDSSALYIIGIIGADVFVLKEDFNGNILWNRTWDSKSDDWADTIAIDSSAIYIIGYTLNNLSVPEHTFVLKYDLNGNLLWNRTIGGPTIDWGQGIAVDSNAIYITGGIGIDGSGGSIDVFVRKYDLNGNLLWDRSWGGKEGEDGRSIAIDSTAIYITGETSSYGAGWYDAFVLKYSKDGDLVWNRTWGGKDNDNAYSIGLDSSAIYITGETQNNSSTNHNHVFILKYDSNGNLLWDHTWGSTGYDFGYDIVLDTSGIYITGFTEDSINSTSDGAFVFKYDFDGHFIWEYQWNGVGRGDMGWGIAIDSSAIYVVGRSSDDAFLLKFEKK